MRDGKLRFQGGPVPSRVLIVSCILAAWKGTQYVRTARLPRFAAGRRSLWRIGVPNSWRKAIEVMASGLRDTVENFSNFNEARFG